VVSLDDLLSCRDVDDSVGVNGWPVAKETSEAGRATRVEWQAPGGRGYFQIPYRCILPQDVDNLLVAGRCASIARNSSMRSSGPSFVTGQAAGTAAALAITKNVFPRALDVASLQAALLGAGVFLGDRSP
jgi:hypothetical protein